MFLRHILEAALFRIRKVPDDSAPANAAAIRQVQDILRRQFPLLAESEVAVLPDKLRDPMRYGFRHILFVAENAQERVTGFALLLHAPDVGFCFLDLIASEPGRTGGGVGGALYERVREEAAALGAKGLFLECLPDDPALSRDPEIRKQNAARLRFYERYGARPIAGTAYETPLKPGGDNPPYLVYDALGRDEPLGRGTARAVVRAILERKYGGVCPPDYVELVVDSIRDDPVRLRPPRYIRQEPLRQVRIAHGDRIPLVVNEKHDVHHVRERGYVEAPVRVSVILRELDRLGLFQRLDPRRFSDRHIRAVHDGAYVDYLRRACEKAGPAGSIYPYVFPIRNKAKPPKELPLRAGYFCIDTFTPLNANAYIAARRAVDCALTAAEQVLEGHRFAYALVRPPGHHAERHAFGGFCYFNNTAVAANYLSRFGRVAVLDIDYHHGNGTQDIFYHRGDVLTVSLHGHPSFAYPYFSGFRDEQGIGPGAGYNLNLPLPEVLTPEQYRRALDTALQRIDRFAPDFLVLAVGFDTATGDPTGSWSNRADDFARIGQAIAARGCPTLVVQEGGYRTRTLGINARRFFEGLWQGRDAAAPEPRPARPAKRTAAAEQPIVWRSELVATDAPAVRELVASTGVFTADEVAVAGELVEERLQRGPASGYDFLMADRDGRLVGYACFGPIPATEGRFDLYWIAVHPDLQGRGLGAELLRRSEQAVAAAGGVRIYVETSTRDAYTPTRAFYRRSGYRKAAELSGFYRDDDGKVIYLKQL